MAFFQRTCVILVLLTFHSGLSWLSAQSLNAVRTPEGIDIREGSQKVLFYQIKPRSLNGQYERSHYIHPLFTLKGNVLTEDFPADHPHHHGIFWSWHQIIHDGSNIADGWTSENIRWEVVKSKIRKKQNCVTLDSKVFWISTIRESEEAIVEERSVITVYPAGAHSRMLDFDIHLLPLKDGLQIGGSDDAKGYGGFSWRTTLPNDIRFVGSEGEVIPQTNAVSAGGWLDAVGSFDGEEHPESGIAVLSHPSNPGHPHPWILRKERSMQNAAFPGRTPVTIPETGLRLKYRVILHDQRLGPAEIAERYQAYSGH